MPEAIDTLLDKDLPDLGKSLLATEDLRWEAPRVDGTIIGTGEADFTKGNTAYVLRHGDATFQLLDVPGIEGDESRYAPLVRQAIARSHLVFYVNGSDKKPEKTTADKIRSYLRRGTQVVALVNVRRLADGYDFEEDRVTLVPEVTRKILDQTMGVLESVLPPGVLLSGHCIHGLLAFAALARVRGSLATSIHPSRGLDLVPQQRSFLERFRSPKAMFEFSRVSDVAQLLQSRVATFREDIVESHKAKVHSLVAEHRESLEDLLQAHRAFVVRAGEGFDAARAAINQAMREFEQFARQDADNLCDRFFSDVSKGAGDAVEAHIDDKLAMQARMEACSKQAQASLEASLGAKLNEYVEELTTNIRIAMQRLAQDLARIDFEQQVTLGGSPGLTFQPIDLETRLDQAFFRSLGLSLAGYVGLGMEIGSAFGPWGTAIGAAVGAVLALVFAGFRYFGGKGTLVRRTQDKVQAQIDSAKVAFRGELLSQVQAVVDQVRTQAIALAHARVDEIQASIGRPLAIMERQIARLADMNHQLEQMPRGTIRTFQRREAGSPRLA